MITLVVCVAGIVGMIVTSILNHNGAAVTFGLVTAVAILCSMVAKSVATSTERHLVLEAANFAAAAAGASSAPVPGVAGAGAEAGARAAGPGTALEPGQAVGPGPPSAEGTAEAGAGSTGGASSGRAPALVPAHGAADTLAELVERQVQAVVEAGADEVAVRQLVGEAVRLGRALAPLRPAQGGSH